MIALVRYLGADLVRSQGFFMPALVFLAATGMIYSGDPGPPLGAFQGTALLLFPVSAWMTLAVVNSEEPIQRSVTLVAGRGWGRVLGGLVVLAAMSVLALIVVALVAPLLRDYSAYPPWVLATGALAHLATGLAGLAVGLVCARPLVPRPAFAATGILVALLATVALGRVPPIGNLMTVLDDGRSTLALPALSVNVAVSLGLLAVSSGVMFFVGRNRI